MATDDAQSAQPVMEDPEARSARLEGAAFWATFVLTTLGLALSINQIFNLGLGGFRPISTAYYYLMIGLFGAIGFLAFPGAQGTPRQRPLVRLDLRGRDPRAHDLDRDAGPVDHRCRLEHHRAAPRDDRRRLRRRAGPRGPAAHRRDGPLCLLPDLCVVPALCRLHAGLPVGRATRPRPGAQRARLRP